MNCYIGNFSIDQFTQKQLYTTEFTSFKSIGWHPYITDTGVLLTVSHSILAFYHSDTLATSCIWS